MNLIWNAGQLLQFSHPIFHILYTATLIKNFSHIALVIPIQKRTMRYIYTIKKRWQRQEAATMTEKGNPVAQQKSHKALKRSASVRPDTCALFYSTIFREIPYQNKENFGEWCQIFCADFLDCRHMTEFFGKSFTLSNELVAFIPGCRGPPSLAT